MNISLKNLSKFALVFALAAFFFAASFGLGHLGTPMAMGASEFDCPYMPGISICNMIPFEHISSWQAMFASLPVSQSGFLALLFLIISFIVAILGSERLFYSPPPLKLFPARLFRDKGDYVPSAFLKEALSRGILNPKLF
ncbi:MAG: hypothetical protein AAB355_00560 [Patescibacteria group bacterium]